MALLDRVTIADALRPRLAPVTTLRQYGGLITTYCDPCG